MSPIALPDAQDGLGEHEFAVIQRLFAQLAGIELPASKRLLAFGRLRGRVQQLGMRSFADYLALVEQPGRADERQRLVDLLTTNETYFFREPRHFDLLRSEITAEHRTPRPFRAWSAASSTGEEAWSIAMVLADRWGAGRSAGWEVLGSDISQRVLDKARSGRYATHRIEGIPAPDLQAWCTRQGSGVEGTLEISEALRQRVSFRHINLHQRLPEIGRFDLVFLRNMLIYFQPDAKAAIVRRVVERIVPGGWLVVGHSESLKNLDARLVAHSPSVYRVADASPATRAGAGSA